MGVRRRTGEPTDDRAPVASALDSPGAPYR
jgi:hypothetical protein